MTRINANFKEKWYLRGQAKNALFIFLVRSLDQGINWNQVQSVYETQEYIGDREPALAVDGEGNLHAIFKDFSRESGMVSLNAVYSPDNGINWSPPKKIFQEPQIADGVIQELVPFIAAKKGTGENPTTSTLLELRG